MRRAVIAGLLVVRSASADPGIDVAVPAPLRTPVVDPAAALPWTLSARHDGDVVFTSYGGYDSSTRTPVLGSSAEAGLADRVTLRVDMSTLDDPSVQRTQIGVVVDLVRQRRSGIDVAVGAAYSPVGWNGVPELIGSVAVGRGFGDTRVFANAAIGAGVDSDERYADIRLAAVRPLGARVAAGVDARVRLDLDLDQDQPANEREWDLECGPTVSYAIGRFAVAATAGVSASKLRFADARRVGAITTLGLATAF